MADDDGQIYEVQGDDCISSIANQFGFFWRTLWFHPQNAQLRSLRKNPNVLMEGDNVFIPTKVLRQESRPVDAQHAFVLQGIPSRFRMCVLRNLEPRANERYVLTLDGQIFDGQTDGDGKIDIFIPPNAQSGKLIVGVGKTQQVFTLDLGQINPVTTPAGQIQRLQNMGYDCGLKKEKGLPLALRSFQVDNNLSDTGEANAATQAKLLEKHGS
jgi:hypothetical protein